MPTLPTLGEAIRRERERRSLSQRDLAIALNLDFGYLCKIETDNTSYPPSERVLERIAEVFRYNWREQEALILLAGRTPSRYRELLRSHPADMDRLLARLSDDPEFTETIFSYSAFL